MRKFRVLLAFAAFFLVLGWVGHQDYQTARMEEAANTCQNQNAYTTPTFDQCMANQMEDNNDR